MDNKVIAEAKPTPIFNALKTANMVRLRPIQLAGWDDFRTKKLLLVCEINQTVNNLS